MNALHGFKPLLAATVETEDDYKKIRFPVLASPKIDGIRCIIHPILGPVTRTLKPIPNNFIRNYLNKREFHYLDGEITVGPDPYLHGIFNATQSAVMTGSGEPDFRYLAFDTIPDGIACPFSVRTQIAMDKVIQADDLRVKHLIHQSINSVQQLDSFDEHWVMYGAEGIMLRHPQGKYKFNRSTLNEGLLLKLKQFHDDEALIIGYDPLERNENQPFKDALGFQKRSSHKSGMVVDDSRIGKFHLRGVSGKWKGIDFKCGSGLTDEQRLEYRAKIHELVNRQLVSYKHQLHGALEKPRAPIFKGFRYD